MKTGFKATYNLICIDHKFEIGQTYELKGKPIPCHYGFHYCLKPKDVLEYYPIKHNFRLLEIEDIGESITKEDKTATNKIRIVREIPKEEYYQLFGIINNELTITRSSGNWEKRKFDERNNQICYEDSFGFCRKREYDERNNCVRYEDPNGYWVKFTYDERNNCIYSESSSGRWEKRQFDENNNCVKIESGVI